MFDGLPGREALGLVIMRMNFRELFILTEQFTVKIENITFLPLFESTYLTIVV